VLVAVASKYGSTREVAQAIADELQGANLEVGLREPGEVTSLDGCDAVVLGSAIYIGRWLESAWELAQDQAAGLASRPTWLFSSGPIGGKPLPEQAVDVSAIVEGTRTREHRLFGGKLDRQRLSFVERALTLALRAPEGDFRDWNEIRAWARQIAASLQVPNAQGGNPA
jgi:menaquinone-dependent protoporphyrinogen oxidase